MKILIITGTFAPSINGVAISTSVLVNNLIKFGHKVLVLAPKSMSSYSDGKEILRYPSVSNPFVKDYPIPLLPITPAIYEKVKRFSPDVVHVHHPFHIGFFAKQVSEQFKIPLVFTYHTKHDYYANEYFKFLPKEIRPKFIANSVLDFCKKCDLVIAPSKGIEAYLYRKSISNVKIIPFIVDDLKKTKLSKAELREKLKLPQDKKILLYVGRISPEKNIDLIIDSMLSIPQNFVLVICGTGPIESEIKKKAKSLKLSKRITFAGKIERKEIGLYYSASDYFFYSSKSETQGLIYWEALNFGLPVVAVESEAAREWIKNSFGLLSVNNAIKMAEGVKNISRLDYDLLSKNATNFAKKFSASKSTKMMLSAYEDVVIIPKN